MTYLPISFKVTSLALGQSCPSANEVTLKDMGKINHDESWNKAQQSTNDTNNLWNILYNNLQTTQRNFSVLWLRSYCHIFFFQKVLEPFKYLMRNLSDLARFRANEIVCWNFYIILWYGNSLHWSQRVSPCLWDFISSYSNMSTDSCCILKCVLEPNTKPQAANMSPVLWCLSDANGMAKSKTGKMTEMADWLLTAMICKLQGLQIAGWIPRLFHSLRAQP